MKEMILQQQTPAVGDVSQSGIYFVLIKLVEGRVLDEQIMASEHCYNCT